MGPCTKSLARMWPGVSFKTAVMQASAVCGRQGAKHLLQHRALVEETSRDAIELLKRVDGLLDRVHRIDGLCYNHFD